MAVAIGSGLHRSARQSGCSGSGSLYGDGGPSSGRKKRDTMKTNLLGGAPLSTAAEHQEETELHPVNR